MNVPSYTLKQGDIITPNPSKSKKKPVNEAIEGIKEKTLPEWLSFDEDGKQGIVQGMPTREDIKLQIEEQLIVELYSR